MGSSTGAAAVLLCVALSVVAGASAAPEEHVITRFCPVQFDEKQQIRKIASKCKGQEIPQPACCAAFRSVACPYATLLDDVTNGCSVALLMKIHDSCSLPTGYFAKCGDSAMGIRCPPRP